MEEACLENANGPVEAAMRVSSRFAHGPNPPSPRQPTPCRSLPASAGAGAAERSEVQRLRDALETARAECDGLRRELAVATNEIIQLRIALTAESGLRLQAAHDWAAERVEAGALHAHLQEIRGSRFWRYSQTPRAIVTRVRRARHHRAIQAATRRLSPTRCRAWFRALSRQFTADARHPAD